MKNKICEEFQSHICEYLDAELSQSDMEKFKSHIEHCESCSKYLNEIAALTSSLAKIEADPPHELHNNIMGKIRNEKFKKRSANITKFVKIFTASSAAIFCLFCVFLLVKPNFVNKARSDLNMNPHDGAEQTSIELGNSNSDGHEINAQKHEYALELFSSETYSQNTLIGKWVDDDGTSFEFKADGVIVLTDTAGTDYYGSYVLLPNNKINLSFAGSYLASTVYKLNGNKLQITIIGGRLPLDD